MQPQRSVARRRRAFVLAGALALAARAGSPQALAPRALSSSERLGVEIATDYGREGAEAVRRRLAPGSPWHDFEPEAARDEIRARLGPAAGARWELLTPHPHDPAAYFAIRFPSGSEELVVFDLDESSGEVRALRSLLDPAPAAMAPSAAASGRSPGASLPAGPLVSVAAGALLLLALGRRARLATVLVAMVACGPAKVGERAAASARAERLGALVELRERQAAGGGAGAAATGATGASGASAVTSATAIPSARPDAAPGGDAGEARLERIRVLWRAEARLLEGAFGEAASLLETGATAKDPPLAAFLRARLATLQLRFRDAVDAYEVVLESGFDVDRVIYEQALAAGQIEEAFGLGAGSSALLAMGARLPEVWYVGAAEAAYADDEAQGEALLRTAWQNEPLPRETLFGDAVLAPLAARPALYAEFHPADASEPVVRPPGASALPPLAPSGSAYTVGARLHLEIGAAPPFELAVPGGAAIAPPGTPAFDALEVRRRSERRALASCRRFLDDAGAASGEIPASLLRDVEVALPALLRERRFAEVDRLSRPLTSDLARLASPVVSVRAAALSRLGRDDEARALLLSYARAQISRKHPAPGALYALAELLAGENDYETAARLVRKADGQLRRPYGEQRLRVYDMAAELQRDSALHRTEHFDIRSPRATGMVFPRDLGAALESERRRLAHYAPGAESARVAVELFPVEQFLSSFGGDIGVVGVFDGRLRVPLADLQTLRPEVVAIVSHELMHALVATATGNVAPHWFQEGLAQWIETGTVAVNPLPELEASGRTISFPLLEPVLRGFAAPELVELAYSESMWAIAYVVATHGDDGVRSLVRSFARGSTTEEAIAALTGGSVEAFDAAFRRWAATKAPVRHFVEPKRFDTMEGALFERATARERGEIAPLVGRRESSARTTGPDAATRREMTSWHTRYRAATQPVRAAYAPILGRLSSQAQMPDAADCARLASSLRSLEAASSALAAPDERVTSATRALYAALGRLADGCLRGSRDATLVAFENVGSRMNAAARAMAPYGVQP